VCTFSNYIKTCSTTSKEESFFNLMVGLKFEVGKFKNDLCEHYIHKKGLTIVSCKNTNKMDLLTEGGDYIYNSSFLFFHYVPMVAASAVYTKYLWR